MIKRRSDFLTGAASARPMVRMADRPFDHWGRGTVLTPAWDMVFNTMLGIIMTLGQTNAARGGSKKQHLSHANLLGFISFFEELSSQLVINRRELYCYGM
jgi:hypothetical protein